LNGEEQGDKEDASDRPLEFFGIAWGEHEEGIEQPSPQEQLEEHILNFRASKKVETLNL